MKLKGKEVCNVIACCSFQPPVCHLPFSSKVTCSKGHRRVTFDIVTKLYFLALTIQAQIFIKKCENMPKLYLLMRDIAVFKMCTVLLPFLALSLAWTST